MSATLEMKHLRSTKLLLPPYLSLVMLLLLGILRRVRCDNRPGILDDFAILQHHLTLHTRFNLPSCGQFRLLLRHPFFCKRSLSLLLSFTHWCLNKVRPDVHILLYVGSDGVIVYGLYKLVEFKFRYQLYSYGTTEPRFWQNTSIKMFLASF